MTATYRGVSAEQIAQTAQDALNLLKNIDLGPEHEKWLKEWLRNEPIAPLRNMVRMFQGFGMADDFNQLVASGPLASIRSAKNSDELLDTMKQTQFGYLFKLYEPLLVFLALSDQVQHDDPKAMDIYKGLKSWGAFASNSYIPNLDLERAVDGFLHTQYEQRWQNAFDDTNSTDAAAFKTGAQGLLEDKIKKATLSSAEGEARERRSESDVRRAEQPVMTEAEGLPTVLSLLDDSEERTRLTSERSDILAYVVRGMQNAVLLQKYGHLLDAESSPIQSYRVEARSERGWDALFEFFRDFAGPLAEKEEIMAADLRMTDANGKRALVFSATRDAAQAFANARPDFQLFDANNRQVKPQAPGSDLPGQTPA